MEIVIDVPYRLLYSNTIVSSKILHFALSHTISRLLYSLSTDNTTNGCFCFIINFKKWSILNYQWYLKQIVRPLTFAFYLLVFVKCHTKDLKICEDMFLKFFSKHCDAVINTFAWNLISIVWLDFDLCVFIKGNR